MPERPAGRVRSATPPAWARWNAEAAARPWTVGVEEEVMLLRPDTWSVGNRIDDGLAVLPAAVATRVSAETHGCVVDRRRREIGATVRALAHREPTMALHVHAVV
jgi:hypothetical protein